MAKQDTTNSASAEKGNIEKIEVIVTTRFRDKNDHKTWYEVGEVQQFEKERAENLIERELAELVPLEG